MKKASSKDTHRGRHASLLNHSADLALRIKATAGEWYERSSSRVSETTLSCTCLVLTKQDGTLQLTIISRANLKHIWSSSYDQSSNHGATVDANLERVANDVQPIRTVV
jgi:hypothetical protein